MQSFLGYSFGASAISTTAWIWKPGDSSFPGSYPVSEAFGVPVDRPQAGMPVGHSRVVAVRCRQLGVIRHNIVSNSSFAKELCPGPS